MKKSLQLGLAIVLALFAACEGPQGPPGPPGQKGDDGLDGNVFLPTVYEIEGDFLANNDYRLSFVFPDNIEVLESDIVLVYLLWEQAENEDGEMLDVWRLLPQTLVLNEGILQYNYDHTFTDVQIFLDGNIDFTTLLEAEALNQVFRIVVLPANFETQNLIQEIDDYYLMLKSLGINPALLKPEISIRLN